MAQQNQVCSFNKFGFCKFGSTCRKQHVSEKCSTKNCEVQRCSLRHPKTCRYYRDYGNCKFGEWCFFNHIIPVSKEMGEIQKTFDSKLEIFENNLKTLKECIAEKDLHILQFKEQVLGLETKIDELVEKVSNLEKEKSSSDLDDKIKDI